MMDCNGILWAGEFGGGEGHYDLYLDFSDDFTGVHICENLPSCLCFLCTAYCMSILL